ncbi:MAG TPA: AsmA family protein [Methylomirabilota bacterium]|nr:AsmA family protein [Methylomirabilota bacterium]
MKKAIRYGLIAIAILILILIALPFFISINQFRPTIEEKLTTALGRQVQVGNLSLSILSGSLSADDLAIADDPAFSKSPFLTAKSLHVGVKLMPLIFSHALNVTGLTIEKPEVTLLHNPQGRWNFSSLGGSSSSSGGSTSATASSFVVEKLELKDGEMIVGSTTSPKRNTYSGVSLEMDNVSFTSQFPIILSATLPGGGTLKLNGSIGPVDATDASLSPLEAKLDISGLDLGATGFVDPSSGLGGKLDLDSTVSSKGGSANAKGDLKLMKLQLVKGSSPAGATVNVAFNSTYDLRRSTGVLSEGNITVGKAVAHVSGTYDLSGETPAVNLKLNGQDMPAPDLEAVLPALAIILPKGASLQSGTLSANLASSGPTSRLITTGTVGLINGKLAGFDLGSKMSALSALSGVQKAADTTIEKFTSNVRVAPDGTQLSALDMVVSGIGEITGSGTIGSDSALDFKMSAGLAALGGGRHGVPFKIEGTTSDPKFVPDVGGMVSGVVGNAISTPSNAAGAIGGLLGKKKKLPF